MKAEVGGRIGEVLVMEGPHVGKKPTKGKVKTLLVVAIL